MAAPSIKEEIANCLGLEVASNPKLLAECALKMILSLMLADVVSAGQKICEIYGITPQDLQYKWEAATYEHANNFASVREAARFTSDSLAGVREQIKRELEQGSGSAKKKTPARSLASGVASINRNKMPFALGRNIHAAQRVLEPQIKAEPDTFNSTEISVGLKGSGVVGPSMVKFRGPKSDVESKKKRACMSVNNASTSSADDIYRPIHV